LHRLEVVRPYGNGRVTDHSGVRRAGVGVVYGKVQLRVDVVDERKLERFRLGLGNTRNSQQRYKDCCEHKCFLHFLPPLLFKLIILPYERQGSGAL
jgi:hypothetical protein